MRILITNDDGWDAPGLACLTRVAAKFGEAVSVAPLEKRSGCGHQITFDEPLTFEACGDHRWRVSGMPGDCVRLALDRLGPFDQVWSGINEGGNLGVDQYLSGTVAAAREATILGVPAIAVSQYHSGPWLESDWLLSGQLAERVLASLVKTPPGGQKLWNVNLPDARKSGSLDSIALVQCRPDPSPLPANYLHDGATSIYRGRYRDRGRVTGLDVDVCFGGAVAITLLPV